MYLEPLSVTSDYKYTPVNPKRNLKGGDPPQAEQMFTFVEGVNRDSSHHVLWVSAATI